mgnify:FL=1
MINLRGVFNMDLKVMEIERLDNGVVTIGINSPPANTLSAAVQNDIQQVLEQFGEDSNTRVLVFHSANPKIFMAGADLGSMSSSAGEGGMGEGVKFVQDLFNQLESLNKPTIAAIDGHALGGGCEFALACDFRVMGGGTIGLTEVTLGLIPGAGGTQRLTKLIGAAKAKELILLGTRLSAQEAQAVGLVHRAVEPGNALQESLELAQQLAAGAIETMGLAKQAIAAAELPLEEGLAVERQAFVKAVSSPEAKEGVGAFMQKRKPNFLQVNPTVSK